MTTNIEKKMVTRIKECLISTAESCPGIGLEKSYPVAQVKDITDAEWEQLVADCLKEGLVVVATDQNGLRIIRYSKGGLAYDLNGIYLEAIDYAPYDESDAGFHELVKSNLPPEYLGKLIGAALFYQTCQQGGANMGMPVPQHIVEQVTQIELILMFRSFCRHLHEKGMEALSKAEHDAIARHTEAVCQNNKPL